MRIGPATIVNMHPAAENIRPWIAKVPRRFWYGSMDWFKGK
jgi:hypothetical protein